MGRHHPDAETFLSEAGAEGVFGPGLVFCETALHPAPAKAGPMQRHCLMEYAVI